MNFEFQPTLATPNTTPLEKSDRLNCTTSLDYLVNIYSHSDTIQTFITSAMVLTNYFHSYCPFNGLMPSLYVVALDTMIRITISTTNKAWLSFVITLINSSFKRMVPNPPTHLLCRAVETICAIKPTHILTHEPYQFENILLYPDVKHHPFLTKECKDQLKLFTQPPNATSSRITFEEAVKQFGLAQAFRRRDIPPYFADDLMTYPLNSNINLNYFPLWMTEKQLQQRLGRIPPIFLFKIFMHPNCTPTLANRLLKRKNTIFAKKLAISGHTKSPVLWCLSHPTLPEIYKQATVIYRTLTKETANLADIILKKAEDPETYFNEIIPNFMDRARQNWEYYMRTKAPF